MLLSECKNQNEDIADLDLLPKAQRPGADGQVA